ncbi:MAG: AMP-binding protein [Verrucomicrobiales bacterium]|nr:AMP-binding protein [Verrucomicrobiales bacterium]
MGALNSLDFWQSASSCVLANHRSDSMVQMAKGVERWLEKQSAYDGCVWLATSGSSGRARFVCLPKVALLESAKWVNEHLQVSSEDRWLCALPSFHVGGLAIYARAVQSACELSIYDAEWDASLFCQSLEGQSITLTSLVPTQVHDLVASGLSCPTTVRAVIVGGEKMDVSLGQAARDLGWPVLQSYGMTEAGSQIATEPLDALQQNFSGEWLDLLSGWQVRVAQQGGSLQIKGAALCRGYLQQVQGGEMFFSEAGDDDSWFTTTDRVLLSEGGREPCLKVLGRSDDVVKVLGEQVSLGHLNRNLQKIVEREKDLHDAVILALPDERKGKRLVAAVVGEASAVDRLMSEYHQLVAPYERIDELRIVDELPRSALGKVSRAELLKLMGQE